MKVALALALVSSTAFADAPREAPTEIEVDRGDAPAGRTEFGFDGGAPVAGWGATLSGGWLEAPISFGLPRGDTSEPVRRRQSVLLGGALSLGDSVVVDGRWAGSRQLGTRLRGIGDERKLDRYVPGDLRIGARIRVMTRPTFAMFVRGELALPTGDPSKLADPTPIQVAMYQSARSRLQILAARTGGTLNAINRLEEMGRLYASVAAELRTLYTIEYQSTNEKRDGRWRAIKIEVSNTDLISKTRQGSFAK